MATTVKSLICSPAYWNALSGAYQATFAAHHTSLAAWMAACPPDLRAGTGTDQIYQGQVGKEEFVSATNLLTISGFLCDATHYIELIAEPGSSIFDSRNNPLRYDGAAGAAIKITGIGEPGVLADQLYFRTSGIQFASIAPSNAAAPLALGTLAGDFFDVDRTLCESSSASQAQGSSPFSLGGWDVSKVRRSVFIQRSANSSARCAWTNYKAEFYNCVFVSTGAVLDSAVFSQYGAGKMQNCYIGNVVAPLSGAGFTVTTCATSAAAPPAGFTTAPFSPATFANIADGTHDFRTVSGSALINIGTADAVNAPTDATGLAWSGGTDIGPWEFASGGGGGTNATAPGATLTGTSDLTTGTATGGSGSTGSFHFDACENNTGAGILNNVAVNWTWISGAVGSASAVANGSGTMTTAGMTVAGLPLGNGFGILKTTDGLVVAYQQGMVT